jgi:hypothetical protein
MAKASDPYASSDAIAQSIQKDLPRLDLNKAGLVEALEAANILVIPNGMAMRSDYKNFPAVPDPGLKAEIQGIISDSGMAVAPLMFYFPSAKMGGFYLIEGNGACSVWRFFSSDGQQTHLIASPRFMENATCSDDGENAYVGLYEKQPVALLIEDMGIVSGKPDTRVQVSSWTGKGWDTPTVFEFNPSNDLRANAGLQYIGVWVQNISRPLERSLGCKIACNVDPQRVTVGSDLTSSPTTSSVLSPLWALPS